MLDICRRINLESLFEQMSSPTSIQMASILNVLDSAYYPCFRSNNWFSLLFAKREVNSK